MLLLVVVASSHRIRVRVVAMEEGATVMMTQSLFMEEVEVEAPSRIMAKILSRVERVEAAGKRVIWAAFIRATPLEVEEEVDSTV
jgi:hypothetical protein